MLLVKFTCIDFKKDPISLDRAEYIKSIFVQLQEDGFIVSVVVECLDGVKIEQQAIQNNGDRLFYSRHVYKNSKHTDIFTIQYIWETYETGLQFSVSIFSDSYRVSPENDYIERLKFAIKEIIKKDWEIIEWMVDKDSECLATDLYPEIFMTENLIRQMISEVMMKYYGPTWWDTFVPLKIKQKYKTRMAGYKGVAPGFANIDDHLLSIDIGDLNTIIGFKHVLWKPAFDESVNLMINGQIEWKDEEVREILKKQTAVDIDFWDKHFRKYLPSDFRKQLETFEKDRNHVAHNKLLDRQAYQSIKRRTDIIKKAVAQALERIDKFTILDEERELNDEEIAEQKRALEEIMESEAGVEVRHDDEIQEILENAFSQVCSYIEEEFRFREDLEINECADSLQITYKITDQQITLKTEMSIDDTQGGTSTYWITSEEPKFSAELTYINALIVNIEDQSYYYPMIEDQEPDIDTVAREIIDYINDNFPNLRQEVEADAYRRIKEGQEPPILEGIACEECGEFYIASDDTYAEKGTCLNCGAKYKVHICERCGSYYLGDNEYDDDEPRICDNCYQAIEDE